jgi:hypothetical protein
MEGSAILKIQRFRQIAAWHGFCSFTHSVKAKANHGAFKARHPEAQDQILDLVLQPPPEEAEIPDLTVPQSSLLSPQVILRHSLFAGAPFFLVVAASTSSSLFYSRIHTEDRGSS